MQSNQTKRNSTVQWSRKILIRFPVFLVSLFSTDCSTLIFHISFVNIIIIIIIIVVVVLLLLIIIFTNPSARAGYDTRSIFKQSLTYLNSEYSFSKTSCLTKAEEHSLPYYLSIAGGRIIGFIPFPRVLVLCEMQSVSSRIWTCIAVSISYDDNHFTTLLLL